MRRSQVHASVGLMSDATVKVLIACLSDGWPQCRFLQIEANTRDCENRSRCSDGHTWREKNLWRPGKWIKGELRAKELTQRIWTRRTVTSKYEWVSASAIWLSEVARKISIFSHQNALLSIKCLLQRRSLAVDMLRDLVERILSARLRREIRNELFCRTSLMTAIFTRIACACSGDRSTPTCFDVFLTRRGEVEEHEQHWRRWWKSDKAGRLEESATGQQPQSSIVTPYAVVRIDPEKVHFNSSYTDVVLFTVPEKQFHLRSTTVHLSQLLELVSCPSRMVSVQSNMHACCLVTQRNDHLSLGTGARQRIWQGGCHGNRTWN